MADRILVWSVEKYPGRSELMPAFYIEEDYEPSAVRIYAEEAPHAGDATFDILCDGTSIFVDKGQDLINWDTGVTTYHTPDTKISLIQGEETEIDEGDFSVDILDEGSWVTARMYSDGAGKFFTICLELERANDNDAADLD